MTSPSRPGPSNPQLSSKHLHPIYTALDSRNYAKVLKLTSSSSGEHADWDIVRALRAHALERSGKRWEAAVLLWDVLAGGSSCNNSLNVWWELADKIDVLSDGTNADDLINDNNSDMSGRIGMDAVQRLDMMCFAVDVDAVLMSGVAAVGGVESSGAAAAAGGGGSAKSSQAKSTGKGKGKKSSSTSLNANKTKPMQAVSLPPITDETVLQTLVVTLKSFNLYDTMSEMYHQAVTEGSKHYEAMNVEQKTEFANVVEEAVCVHFKAVCDCDVIHGDSKESDNSKSYTLRDLQTQQHLTKYYERMQSTALQLAKYTSEPLHFQWTAVSSLWYRESLETLVKVMQYFHALLNAGQGRLSDVEKKRTKGWLLKILNVESVEEIPSKCETYQQKMGLLPRLAETLSYRMIQNKLQDGAAASRKQYAPSENDWDIYLETLLVQGKIQEALEALSGIDCSPLVMDGNDTNSGSDSSAIPQIHDEQTIENNMGTILPYTQRKKLEQMSILGLKLGKMKEVEGWYRQLLNVFPDQWTYWMGLVDSSVVLDGVVDEVGWEACQSFAREVIVKNNTLRGPRLVLVELAALKIRHSIDRGEGNIGEAIVQLRKAICDYGDRFSPVASCCFTDLRPYLELLVRSAGKCEAFSDISDDIALVLKWAKGLWMIHSQSNSGAALGEVSSDELRKRRKKLRVYIFAVQVCYCLAAELCTSSSLMLELLQSYTPPISEMMSEWRTSLAFLPGVPPKDGGQKETLPGDDIVLLMSQYLQLKAACEITVDATEQHLISVAGLLEEAIEHSPYNPCLKIVAIEVYSGLNATYRAYEHYQAMGVKHIQLDSCSYLILPSLIRGGLYTHAVQLSSSIMRFHSSTSKDVKEYSTKSFRKGYLLKAKELVTFQRQKMRLSAQMIQAKGFVMDCAALLNASDITGAKQKCEIRLGSEKGLCGGEEDVARAEQLVRDAQDHFNVPSIMHSSSNVSSAQGLIVSDNRDLLVNYFDILQLHRHPSATDIVNESLTRGHAQGLLIRAVMVVDVAKAPKKGKVPKNTDVILSRCQSLLVAVEKARCFAAVGGETMNQIDKSLWEGTCLLCDVIAEVIQGNGGSDPTDSLADRENNAVSTIKLATTSLAEARAAASTAGESTVCKLLPDRVVPLFTLIETTARLFALFGWGKRKRATKETAAALANLVFLFKELLVEMLHTMKQQRVYDSSKSNELSATLDIGTDYMQKAIGHVITAREMTAGRVDPFLVQMVDTLLTYFIEES